MSGLVAKDFLVFKKCFRWIYRIACIAVLAGAVVLFPYKGAHYIALMLPVLGSAFLTEIVKVEEKTDWRGYLPALPITSREIVLSRYIFCGIVLSFFSVLSFALCLASAMYGGFALGDVMNDYIFGVWFAVLLVCFGIPGGFLFKNELCTGTMMSACLLIAIVRGVGADTFFFSHVSLAAYCALMIVTMLMVFASYQISLRIYFHKRKADQC